MGSQREVRETISGCLPRVNWSDPHWGILEGEGYSFEFNVGREEPVDSLMIHARGGGDAVAALDRLAAQTGWFFLDCAQGEWLHHCQDRQAGWTGFQAYRDNVFDKVAAAPPVGASTARGYPAPVFWVLASTFVWALAANKWVCSRVLGAAWWVRSLWAEPPKNYAPPYESITLLTYPILCWIAAFFLLRARRPGRVAFAITHAVAGLAWIGFLFYVGYLFRRALGNEGEDE